MEFDIYVISLVNAIKRRAQITAILSRESVEWEFFDAICGSNLGVGAELFDIEECMRFPGYALKPNEIACFLSHREIWKKCVSSQRDILILEDDAVVSEDFIGKLKDTLSCIDTKEIEILRLGNGSYRAEKKKIFNYCGVSAFRYREDPFCAFSYILTPKAAEKLLEKSNKFHLAVDNYIWRMDIHNALVLDLSPHLFKAFDDNQSTIGERLKPKHNLLKKISIEFYRALSRKKQKNFENKIFKKLN